METLLIAIAISLSTNVDNLAIGVAYSTKSQSIPFSGNLIIALLSGLSTFASMSLGTWACHFLPAAFSQWFGSGLLILIGSLSIIEQLQALQQPQFATEQAVCCNFSPLSLQDSCLLGLGLTISNLGTGVGAGMAHLNILLVSVLSLLTSLIMISGGTWLGRMMVGCSADNRFVGWFTGFGLIALGTYEAVL
jgi:putative Mn2+ efflux pump MntP